LWQNPEKSLQIHLNPESGEVTRGCHSVPNGGNTVCVCVCARAGVCVCVYVCVFVCVCGVYLPVRASRRRKVAHQQSNIHLNVPVMIHAEIRPCVGARAQKLHLKHLAVRRAVCRCLPRRARVREEACAPQHEDQALGEEGRRPPSSARAIDAGSLFVQHVSFDPDSPSSPGSRRPLLALSWALSCCRILWGLHR
jgi:hypothetical protein